MVDTLLHKREQFSERDPVAASGKRCFMLLLGAPAVFEADAEFYAPHFNSQHGDGCARRVFYTRTFAHVIRARLHMALCREREMSSGAFDGVF